MPTAAAVGLPALGMLLLGLWGLGRGSAMGYDESITRWAARLTPSQLHHLLSNVDAVHGLYYLLMHGWVRVVGSSPAVLRVPSVIAVAGGIAFVVVIGRRSAGSRLVGVVAGLFTAANSFISYYAQTARSYGLVLLCVLAATAALLLCLRAEATPRVEATAGTRRGPRLRRWLLYAALLTLAGYLNELALLVLAAHAATVLCARVKWAARARWLAAAVLAVVLLVPLIMVSSGQTSAVAALTRPGRAQLVQLWHDYFGGALPVAIGLSVLAVIGLLPARPTRAAAKSNEQGAPDPRRPAVSLPAVGLPLLVLPAGILLLEAMIGTPFYSDRYVLYGQVGASLLAAAGACRVGDLLARSVRTRRWTPALVPAVAALAVVLAIAGQFGAQRQVRTPQSRLFDFGAAAHFVGARARPGDGAVFVESFLRAVRMGYPEQFRDTVDLAQAASPARTGTLYGRNQPADVVRRRMLAHRRIWLIEASPIRVDPFPVYEQIRSVLLAHFTKIESLAGHGVDVSLWTRVAEPSNARPVPPRQAAGR